MTLAHTWQYILHDLSHLWRRLAQPPFEMDGGSCLRQQTFLNNPCMAICNRFQQLRDLGVSSCQPRVKHKPSPSQASQARSSTRPPSQTQVSPKASTALPSQVPVKPHPNPSQGKISWPVGGCVKGRRSLNQPLSQVQQCRKFVQK